MRLGLLSSPIFAEAAPRRSFTGKSAALGLFSKLIFANGACFLRLGLFSSPILLKHHHRQDQNSMESAPPRSFQL